MNQFRPIVPDALPPLRGSQESWRRRSVLWAVGFAATVILGVVTFQMISSRVAQNRSDTASLQEVVPTRPLTMREANALLATAPSYKEAVDRMAFRIESSTIPEDKESALAVLAKVKIKL